MKDLSVRTSRFSDSMIRQMTRISLDCGAINLSQGFPDFEPPKEITDRLKTVADEGPHQYAVTWGAPNFREALAKKQSHFTRQHIDPMKNVVVTCGSTEAMVAAMMAVTNPGDKVVLFSPFFENYIADTILCGTEPIYVPLIPPDFKFNVDALEKAICTEGVKALLVCNPSNPSGKVFSEQELQIIADLAIKHDIYVITDEVYEHIIYAPHKHTHISTLKGMEERTLVCSSLSKTFSITGWRLGYVISSERIIDRVKKVHDFLTVGAAAPLMEAAVVGLNFGDDYYIGLQQHYTHMKNLFTQGLKDLGIPFTDPQGAYFVLADISKFGYKSDVDFCVDLAQKIGVGAVPASCFFKEDIHHLIRLHFAKKDKTLNEALNRLEKINILVK